MHQVLITIAILPFYLINDVWCCDPFRPPSASTPRHLHSIGLLDTLVEDDELDINFLLRQALVTVATLPFHLVNDVWRWRVFRGDVSREG